MFRSYSLNWGKWTGAREWLSEPSSHPFESNENQEESNGMKLVGGGGGGGGGGSDGDNSAIKRPMK